MKLVIERENITSLAIAVPQKIICYVVATEDEIMCSNYDGQNVLVRLLQLLK